MAGGIEGSWLLLTLVILAALECVAVILLGRRSLHLVRRQQTLQAMLGSLRSRLEETAGPAAERRLVGARDAAEAASAAKSRFLGYVAHEFRTPLNGIIGVSDLLLDGALTPDQANHARTIRQTAESFLGLVEQILDFTAIEAGRLALRPEPVDLVQLVEGVAELLAPRARAKGIEIATCVSGTLPRRVMADRERLRQILLNLAGNAVKFTQAGGVGIVLEGDGSGLIRLSVEDTGPGIAPDRQTAIFDDFEQGHGAGGHEEGTGLGLAITRRLVAALGGELRLESEPGRGSVFHVTLDLAAAPMQDRRRLPDCRGKRVLVMAPATIGTRLLARRLDEAGVLVDVVADVASCRRSLANRPYDSLIVDMTLGEEAVGEAGTAPSPGPVRRIVMLLPHEKRNFGQALPEGYDAYLRKPVRTRSLFQQIAPSAGIREASTKKPASKPSRRRFLRVLLAEDNDVNALIAIRALERIGATADWARTGPEALGFAEEALDGRRPRYDSMLMDIRLPGLDGFEVTRRIRRREAETGTGRPVRIVALSAQVSEADRAAAAAAGLDDFLAKPFTPEALREALLPLARRGALRRPAA